MMMVMRIFYSPDEKLRDSQFEIHDGKIVQPFERPERMQFILDALERRSLPQWQAPDQTDLQIAKQVHRSDYISFLETAYDEWLGAGKSGEALTYVWPAQTLRQDVIPAQIEAKLGYYSLTSETTITKGTWQAILASKNCAEAATQAVMDGARAAFSLARPPGHHASSYQLGGYCFLNNAAIAAQKFVNAGASRVSILDIDFHHGNGTQDIFYKRNDVQFLSLHGDPLHCFPYFLGYADEKGADAGEVFNHNYPLPKGTGFELWSKALKDAISKIHDYAPDALVISLGVDTYENDPISAFKLKTENFLEIGAMIKRAGLPTVFIMEGGYAIEAIGENVANVLQGFLEN